MVRWIQFKEKWIDPITWIVIVMYIIRSNV